MKQVPHGVVVECDETIARPPQVVWLAIRTSDSAASRGLERIQPSPEMFMEQRVVERNDEVMVVRMKMTASSNLPWSAYESTIRVEAIPKDPSRSRVVLTCLAAPTDEERTVTGLILGLMLLSLRSLKTRVEST